MSATFDPVAGASANANWKLLGGVTKIVQLPAADKSYYGAVAFCHEDKRFYECRHIVTEELDYYRWVAVTQGGQRLFFIPVEKLTAKELGGADSHPPLRTNSFDAAMSALNEVAFGLLRYNVKVAPFCYKLTTDNFIEDGVAYFRYNNQYDRADYVATTDTTPVAGKSYFCLEGGVLVTKIFAAEEEFAVGVTYYESTRPMFVEVAKEVGTAIDELLFNSDGVDPNSIHLDDLIAKYNVLVDILNVSGSKLHVITEREMTSGEGVSLFQLCGYINELIDEVNPFAVPWNNVLDRIAYLEDVATHYGDIPADISALTTRVGVVEEKATSLQEQVNDTNERFDDFVINFPVVINKGAVKYTMDFVEGAGNRMLTCKKHSDQSVEHKYVFPMTIIRNGVTYYLDFDDSDPSVTEKTVYATRVTS